MDKALSADCLYSPGIEYTLNCARVGHEKSASNCGHRNDTPDNIVGAMLREKDVWDHVAHSAEGIVRVKKGVLERL